MQVLRLNAAAAAKWKAATPAGALFKKGELKKARDMSRRHRGELVKILGPDDELLDQVQEGTPR
jgi:hypothetical protein